MDTKNLKDVGGGVKGVPGFPPTGGAQPPGIGGGGGVAAKGGAPYRAGRDE